MRKKIKGIIDPPWSGTSMCEMLDYGSAAPSEEERLIIEELPLGCSSFVPSRDVEKLSWLMITLVNKLIIPNEFKSIQIMVDYDMLRMMMNSLRELPV